MIFENTTAMVKHAVIFEDGDPEYDQDFIVVVQTTPDFHNGKPYHIITVIDDERPSFACHLGELSPSDIDVMMRELVTGMLYRQDEPEYDASFDSIQFLDVSVLA